MADIAFRSSDFIEKIYSNKSGKQNIVIAIDGPAASGKGTLARKIANRFGYAYLDTGLLYRAVAFALLMANGNVDNDIDVKVAVQMIKRNLTPELLSHSELRTDEVSQMASKVASLPEVRQALLEYQYDFAENPPEGAIGAILDGRDIGTVVCPNADIKIYMTADEKIRAKRRFDELVSRGIDTDLETVLNDLRQRDARDKERTEAPLKMASDAFIIDASHLKPFEIFEEVVGLIRAQMLKAAA